MNVMQVEQFVPAPKRWIQRSKVIARRQTPIQTIELEALTPEDNYALFLDGCIQFVSGHDDLAYHGALATVPAARLGEDRLFRALILGGGDGLAARNLCRMPNCAGVTMVELDRGMLEFCATHPVVRKLNEDVFRNPKLKTKVGDARTFVDTRPTTLYDVAVVDFPDPSPEIIDLYRRGFYEKLLRHMNPERSVVAVQSSNAHSPVEDLVEKNLSEAMGAKTQSVYFRGRFMDDGAVVIGQRGL